jgi:hypothetical protein
MKKVPSDSPIRQLKKRESLLSLSFLITKPIKLDLSNPHYQPHYRRQGCVIREKNITAFITNPTKAPIKDTLVPLQTNFNANGSVRWRTSLYLNLFHWPMGKNSGNGDGVCKYVRALSYCIYYAVVRPGRHHIYTYTHTAHTYQNIHIDPPNRDCCLIFEKKVIHCVAIIILPAKKWASLSEVWTTLWQYS